MLVLTIRTRMSRSVRAPARWLLAATCYVSSLCGLATAGCDSGSSSVPTSATKEQIDQVQKAQQDAATEEMQRPPAQ